MGGISSKNGQKNSLLKVESTEQFSVWRTTVLEKGSFKCDDDGKAGEDVGFPNTHSMQVYLYPHPPTTHSELPGNLMKLGFFLRRFEKCVGVDDDEDDGVSDVTVSKGYSLWMTVKRDNNDNHKKYQENDLIFSVKMKKSVNGQEEESREDQMHKDVIAISSRCQNENFLLEENFLVLGFQQRNLRTGRVKKNVTLLGNLVKLRVDFAVKIMYASGKHILEENERVEGRTKEGSTYLMKDLKKLYTGEVLTDVVLKAADGMVVKSHKVILAARSGYFSRLIQWNPYSFSDKSVPFVIDNVSGRALLAVVHWMYTGELLEDVGVDVVILEEMIQAARKFEMGDLLKVLEKRRNLNGGSGGGRNEISNASSCKDSVKKIKRAVLAWFPLLRYRFGNRRVGLVASIINAIYGIYELV